MPCGPPVALRSGVEVRPLQPLRLLVVVGEGNVETVQHPEDLAILGKLAFRISRIRPRTRKDQHTERPASRPNRPIQSPQDRLQLANAILDWRLGCPLDDG